jgi:V/A-type H+-transporting ATPase subunit I
MAKVEIIATKDKLDPTLKTLHRLGAVQIEDVRRRGGPLVLPRMTLDAAALAQREEIGLLVTRLESLLALLPKQPLPENAPQLYEEASARVTGQQVAEAKKILGDIGTTAQELALRRDEFEAERAALPRYQATIRKVMPLAAELPDVGAYETVALLIERRFSAVLDVIHQELTDLVGDQFELNTADVDEETTAAVLVFPKEQSAKVNSLLGRENVSRVRLPKELARVSFKDALAAIGARLAAIPGELESIRARLEDLAAEWHVPLALLRAVLRDRLQQLEVAGRLGATHYTFVLVGWLPRRNLGELKDALALEVGARAIVNEIKVDKKEMEHAPVVLSNPPPARPFEFLLRLLGLPKYGALDPTPLLALFMPLFFGMILGDVAYGILVLLIAVVLLRRFRTGALHSLAQVMIYCGVWAVIFGVLFGEFLGSFGRQTFRMKPLWMERSGETLTTLLIFTVAVGGVHVVLGLILGMWEAIHRRSGKELVERIGKFVALLAIFWLVGVLSRQLPREFLTLGVAALIVGIVLLSAPMGWVGIILGPIEVLGVAGNILSYLRLAAIGLSSVYLAEVANRLQGMSANIVVGVLIAGLLHALNLALGIVSPTIQSLRLHYVEFFSKFYEGGGEAFKPFKQTGL